MTDHEFNVEAVVHGYHIMRRFWRGEKLVNLANLEPFTISQLVQKYRTVFHKVRILESTR